MTAVAVLDACVLYPVSLRDVLLRCAEADLFRLVWSERILQETKGAVLNTRPDIPEVNLDRILAMMRGSFPDVEPDGWEELEGRMANHPNDRHVLAVAIAACADLIVTSNLKHFPDSACDPFGIEAIGPDHFLCRLLGASREAMHSIIVQMAADCWNPPMTPAEVIASIGRFAPEFAAELTRLD